MRSHTDSGVLVAAAFLLFQHAVGNADASTIISDFEDGTVQGWTISEAAVFQQQQPGGNPNGFLYIDNTEIGIATLFAPAAFLGNLSAFNGGVFSFDGKLLGAGGGFWNSAGQDYGWVTITGTNADSATLDLLPGGAIPPSDAWQTYSIALAAAAWGKSDAAWAAILADVAQVKIVVEGLFGPEIQGIDNISLVSSVTSEVPLPPALLLFASGIAVILGAARRRRAATGLIVQ
ncbi:MAG: hypothetical protein WEA28_00910 [Xanthobacteraceae bacterium]